MKLPALICSDLHLTAQSSTEYRWGLFPWLTKMIKAHHVRTLLILGDLTQAKDNHSAELTNRVVQAINSLPIDDIRILVGNHDWLKQGQEFFRFLSLIPSVEYINDIREDAELHGPTACFLPYSKNPAKDWAGRDFSHYQYLFLHQTIKGAIASNGQAMEGEELPALNAGRVFSGDIHVPQNIGGLTYVGSPYHVHFGDKFKPRCILIDKHGGESDLHFETEARVVIKVSSLRELKWIKLNSGDQVKLRIELDESDKHGWSALRRDSVAFLSGLGVVVAGVELIIVKARRRASIGGNEGQASLTPPDAIWRYVEHEELGGAAYDAAMEVFES